MKIQAPLLIVLLTVGRTIVFSLVVSRYTGILVSYIYTLFPCKVFLVWQEMRNMTLGLGGDDSWLQTNRVNALGTGVGE